MKLIKIALYIVLLGIGIYFLFDFLSLEKEEPKKIKVKRILAPYRPAKRVKLEEQISNPEAREDSLSEKELKIKEEDWKKILLSLDRKGRELNRNCEKKMDELFPSEEIINESEMKVTNFSFFEEKMAVLKTELSAFYAELAPLQNEFDTIFDHEIENFKVKDFLRTLRNLEICRHHNAQMFFETLPEIYRRNKASGITRSNLEVSYVNMAVSLLKNAGEMPSVSLSALGIMKMALVQNFFRDRDSAQLERYYLEISSREFEFREELEGVEDDASEAYDIFRNEMNERKSQKAELVDFLENGF